MLSVEMNTWDVHSPLPRSTSVLYPLEPCGVGTPWIESLTSYLKRLAHAHHLKVVDMVKFCSSQTDKAVLPSTLQKLSRIDGMTDGSGVWAVLLGDLTCQPSVSYLSMRYWRSVLNPYRMLRQSHAWCPQCFAAAAQQEMPCYEPLLWRLQCVEICTLHHYPLVEICPHCGSRFTTLSHWAVVGYCPKCQSWLGEVAPVEQPTAYDREAAYPCATAVGRLLALAPLVHPAQCNPMAQIIPLLRQQHHTTHSHLARVMLTKASGVSALLGGRHLPNLTMFSRLAAYSGERFWQAFTQHPQAVLVSVAQSVFAGPSTHLDQLLTSPQRLPSLHTMAYQCGFDSVATFRQAFPFYYEVLWQRVHTEQRLVLEQALQQAQPVVLSKWAAQHGYRTNDLYHHFYDLCVQITQRFHADKATRCWHYLQNLLQDQSAPTFSEICRDLNVGKRYLKKHFADALQVIESRHQQQMQALQSVVGAYLDQVVAQDRGTLSLEQVAQTVGKSIRYLKHNFPLQSQMILERRRAHMTQQVQATCDCIRQTVFELHQQGIYPSVDRIHAVIGAWMVHGKPYRRAYIEAMTQCGYLSIPRPPQL